MYLYISCKGVEDEQSNMLQRAKLSDSQIASVILTKVFVIVKILVKNLESIYNLGSDPVYGLLKTNRQTLAKVSNMGTCRLVD